VTIYTIGFTKKSARRFFEAISGSGAKRLLDVRLHNSSQLAGFAKRDDLAFFLERLCGVPYLAEQLLAPEPEMLAAYRGKKLSWDGYMEQYVDLLRRRGVESHLSQTMIDDAVLLCSEDRPDRCHRRLAAEYLARAWGGGEITHL
jgi:uncharacterized protein (DUF488 family)